MKISLGCDHAGFEYKEKIKAVLSAQGHEIEDFGTYSDRPCDYPDYIRPAAEGIMMLMFYQQDSEQFRLN